MKRERKRRQREEATAAADEEERETEDAQMFKSIRSMMLADVVGSNRNRNSGGSSGVVRGGVGGLTSSSNTTSTEEEADIEDGLIDHHHEPLEMAAAAAASQLDELDVDDAALPSQLIVTGLPSELFTSGDDEIKRQFEAMFTRIEPTSRFAYFRLLKRCCVHFDEPIAAVLARLELDRVLFMGSPLKMYLNKVTTTIQLNN